MKVMKDNATNFNFVTTLDYAGRTVEIKAQLKEARNAGVLSGQFIGVYLPETIDELKAIIAKHGEEYILDAFQTGTALNRKTATIAAGTISDKHAMEWLIDGISSDREKERRNVCIQLMAKKATTTLDLWLVSVKDAMKQEKLNAGKLTQDDILGSDGEPKEEYMRDLFESNVQ